MEVRLAPEVQAAITLSQQVSPILAEGTKGNPRQIKRFLNSLLLRYAIADARGFAEDITRQRSPRSCWQSGSCRARSSVLPAWPPTRDSGKVAALAAIEEIARAAPARPARKSAANGQGSIRKRSAAPVPATELDVETSEWSRRGARTRP